MKRSLKKSQKTFLWSRLMFKSLSTAAAQENAATPFCCEAPGMLCGLQNVTRLPTDMGLSR